MWPVGEGDELPSVLRTVAQSIATPLISLTVRYQVIAEVGARSHGDCPRGLPKWAAQPDFEAGKGVGTVLNPTSHDA